MKPPLPDDPPTVKDLFGDLRPRLRGETVEELDKIIESSSEKNRNFFIAYLGLLVYVLAIVFSTTDVKLLVDTEGLRLPIIDLNVPLVGFYVVVPIFVIALHFNFLQNLESHHYKLMRWKDAHPGKIVPRSRIQAFLFDYATLETGSQLERWVRWSNSLLVLNLAPISLGLLLLRYTDRQDGWITLWHLTAFIIDCHLVWKLRLAIEHNQSPQAPLPNRKGWQEIHKHGLRGLFGALLFFESVLTVATAWLPSETFVTTILPFAVKTEAVEDNIARWLLSLAKIHSIQLPHWFENYLYTFKSSENTRLASLLLPRIAIKPNETVWKPDQKALETEAKMAGERDWIKYFNKQGEGFRPSTLNLRLGRLAGQHLPKAYLKSAQLEGIDLSNTQLYSANLEEAHIQNGNLQQAQLQEANLSKAQLQGSSLWLTQMQGAIVTHANLVCADLGSVFGAAIVSRPAQLQGADLTGANLQGANLGQVDFRGADLSLSKLQSSSLWGTQFNGAIFFNTELKNTGKNPATFALPELMPMKSHIYNVYGVGYKDTSPNWPEMQYWANRSIKEGPCEDILTKKSDKSYEYRRENYIHDAQIIYRTVIPELCNIKESQQSRLAAIRGIRRNYRNVEDSIISTKIDNTLCILPQCADLKADIQGLDCKSSGSP